MGFVFLFIFYFAWFPLAIFIGKLIGKAIKNQFRRKMRIKPSNNQDIKEPMTRKLWTGIKFEAKGDKRPLTSKGGPGRTVFFWSLMGVGIVLSLIGMFTSFSMIMFGYLFPVIAAYYAYFASRAMLDEQRKSLQRLFDTKKASMGLVSSPSDNNFDAEFKILKWGKDKVSFDQILLYIPTQFDQLATGSFLEKINQNFGGDTAWVADEESDTHGWDFVGGKVTIKRTPALPGRADWNAHYLLNDRIAWSFFPLGLGTGGGVPLKNPKTGKEEHVLGFDLQGLEPKLAKKQGFDVGPEIVAAPMSLVSGGTGGGKSLAETTPVSRVISDNEKDK